ANTSFTRYPDQPLPLSMTSLTNGGDPRRTTCSQGGARSGVTRRISPFLLPGAAVMTGEAFAAGGPTPAGVEDPPAPGPHRKEDDGQGAAALGAEGTENLLEPCGDAQFVGERPGPDGRRTGRTRGHGHHVAVLEAATAAQPGQRVPPVVG